MSDQFLGDALGPRGRRTTRILTAISLVAIAGFIFIAITRLGDKGQLDKAKWEPFTTWPIQKFFLEGIGRRSRCRWCRWPGPWCWAPSWPWPGCR